MHKNTKDLTGKKFGRLVVLGYTNSRSSDNSIMWKVLCSCRRSRPFLVATPNLNSGHSTQCKLCACDASGRARIKDLTGKKFGNFTVIRLSDKRSKSGRLLWECLCTCNSMFLIQSGNLTNGHSTQCRKCANRTTIEKLNPIGSISKTASLLIDKLEEEFKFPVIREFQIENRFYDCCIPELNLLIESDGSYWHSTEKAKLIDKEKNELALKYNYELVRVVNNKPEDIAGAFEKIKLFLENGY